MRALWHEDPGERVVVEWFGSQPQVREPKVGRAANKAHALGACQPVPDGKRRRAVLQRFWYKSGHAHRLVPPFFYYFSSSTHSPPACLLEYLIALCRRGLMAPPNLNLDDSSLADVDVEHATSPAISIHNADRFPASPWNEYDTNWKFSAPDIDARNSNPYTPSYNGSFNSWGSHSVSWGGREKSDPMNLYEDADFIMEDEPSSRRPHHPRPDDDYNPSHYDRDIIVGDMDDMPSAPYSAPRTAGGGPQLSFTPALPAAFAAHQEQSPAFSGASVSSPGSDIDLSHTHTRSRASSSASSAHHPSLSTSPPAELSARTFNSALSFDAPANPGPAFAVATHPPPASPGMKPHSPPALVIPGEDSGLAPPQNTLAPPGSPSPSTARPGLSAPGVSIHIVPSTPVGGLDVSQQRAAAQGGDVAYMDQSPDMPQGASASSPCDVTLTGPQSSDFQAPPRPRMRPASCSARGRTPRRARRTPARTRPRRTTTPAATRAPSPTPAAAPRPTARPPRSARAHRWTLPAASTFASPRRPPQGRAAAATAASAASADRARSPPIAPPRCRRARPCTEVRTTALRGDTST